MLYGLKINVFVLGATYLRLVRELGLGPQLPLIEPSVYISRFAHLLEFGDETQRVAHDAIRLVKRFNRDWMQTGRRPAGMCGAALVLAARMNNFRRSISEVVQVVKIADVTIKKRLEEFKHTASGALSVQEFREVWLEESADPPAYTDGLKKDAAKKKAQLLLANGASSPASSNNAGGAFGELLDDASALPESSTAKGESSKKSKGKRKQQPPVDEMSQEDAEFVDSVINSEIETSLSTKEGAALAAECDELDAERQQQAELNQLNDEELDEEELEWFILSPEEVKEKERLWVEMNKEYLQQVAGMPPADTETRYD